MRSPERPILITFCLSSDVDIEAQFSINQSRADEITMREDYGSLPLAINDDGFGDIGFDTVGTDFIRDGVDPNIDVRLLIFLPLLQDIASFRSLFVNRRVSWARIWTTTR